MGQPNEQELTRAAEAAINDLQLDCRVERVFKHPNSGDKWCIRFSGDYGQFCDEFRNASGEENSPRLIREKVKGYFIKRRQSVRVRRGSTSKTDKGRRESNLTSMPIELARQTLDQTTRFVGEVIGQVSDLARSALDTEAVVSVELPTVAPAPTPRRKSRRVKQTAKKKAAKSGKGKTTRKSSSRAGKSTTKTRKATKKGGSKKGRTTKRSSKKRK
jgi:hypothetical protein